MKYVITVPQALVLLDMFDRILNCPSNRSYFWNSVSNLMFSVYTADTRGSSDE
jgi:hypothetical protein